MGVVLAIALAGVNFVLLPAIIFSIIQRRWSNTTKYRKLEFAIAVILVTYILAQFFYGLIVSLVACNGECGVVVSDGVEKQSDILISDGQFSSSVQKNVGKCGILCAKLLDNKQIRYIDVEHFPVGREKDLDDGGEVQKPKYSRFSRLHIPTYECNMDDPNRTGERAWYRTGDGTRNSFCVSRTQIAQSPSNYSFRREYRLERPLLAVQLFLGDDLKIYTETLFDRNNHIFVGKSREVIYRPSWLHYGYLLGPLHIHRNVKFGENKGYHGLNLQQFLKLD